MPKISIIVPCYNTREYLHRSLPSCLNQTFKDIEIICVNDGSTDNTAEILQKYADKDNRIKIITQENQGTLMARKRGMEHASGEYCMFLDPDDFYELHACQELYQCIEEQKVDIVDYRFNIIKQDNTMHNYPLSPLSYKKINSLEALEKIMENRSNFHSVIYIWKKILSFTLYKKVMSHIPEIYMTLHEDVLMVFLCFYFAKTYYTVDNIYYNYYKNIGFCKEYSFPQFQKAISATQIFHSYFTEFVEKQKPPLIFTESLTKIIYEINKNCFTMWDVVCPPERKEEGFSLILDTVSKNNITENYMLQYQRIQNQEKFMQDKDKLIQNQKKLIQNKDNIIQNKDKLIKNKEADLRFYTSLPTNPLLTQALRSFHSHFPFLFRIYSFVVRRTYQVFQSLKQNGFWETCKKIVRYIHNKIKSIKSI
ncbi:MAG: glycosyltransferase family 2 protein [Planctomycetes bacterium]|jgi:glycosyltransferase involved in cell wall biosynthesis|nr:glycosyltransferase family 2 protein [Planctomycetota bacterium]